MIERIVFDYLVPIGLVVGAAVNVVIVFVH